MSDDESTNYCKFVINVDKISSATYLGQHNAPTNNALTNNEVAVLLVDQRCDKMDIVLHMSDDRLRRVSETRRSYDTHLYFIAQKMAVLPQCTVLILLQVCQIIIRKCYRICNFIAVQFSSV